MQNSKSASEDWILQLGGKDVYVDRSTGASRPAYHVRHKPGCDLNQKVVYFDELLTMMSI